MSDVLWIFVIAGIVFVIGAIIILCRAASKGSRAEEELWHQEVMLKERISAASVKDDDDTTRPYPPGVGPGGMA